MKTFEEKVAERLTVVAAQIIAGKTDWYWLQGELAEVSDVAGELAELEGRL